MTTSWLENKGKLLFYMTLCITVGGWMITLKSWHDALSIGAIGGLLLLLGNNVFANLLRNVGIIPTNNGGNGNSTPTINNKP